MNYHTITLVALTCFFLQDATIVFAQDSTGAMALRNIMDSQNSPSNNTFPARNTLGKLAEDLHYAGQGLDSTDPSDAKLKMICEDISCVWGNMSQQRQSPSSQ